MRHQQGLLTSYYSTKPLREDDFNEYFPSNHKDPDMPDVSKLAKYLNKRYPYNGTGTHTPPEEGESGMFRYKDCVIVKVGGQWVNGVVVRRVWDYTVRCYLVYIDYGDTWYQGVFTPADGTIISDSPMTRYSLRRVGYTQVTPP